MEFKDATELAQFIRDGTVEPTDVIEDAIDRVESVNDRVNAVVTRLYDRARRRVNDDPPTGLFGSVPFLLKDLLAPLEGSPMHCGSRFMEDYIPDHNSYLVDRYREAGLVVLGKTNTPEFGLTPTTEPELSGPTKNPWDDDLIAGGSSGGSAAAVASGMVPMAHGNDGGGSLRIPAACCGVFGLKPTRGRISLGPDFGDLMGGFVAEHAVTRTVRDSARLLDATRGAAVGDPYRACPPERSYTDEIDRNPGVFNIAVLAETPTDVQLDSDCRSAVEDAADLCRELGHRVEPVTLDLPTDLIQDAFVTVWAAAAAASVDGAAVQSGRNPSPENFEPLTWALYEMGKDFSAPDYMMAQTLLQRISREFQQNYFTEYDLLLSPTLSRPPVELGHFDSPEDSPLEGFYRAFDFVQFTPIFNMTGQPAMSVPLFWNDQEVPVGVQFAGKFGREDQLFQLASQLENARNWTENLPPINAF